MIRFDERYAGAVHSSNLRSRADTTASDSDVLGAAGLAAKKRPLAMALMRMFMGDDREARFVIDTMTGMLIGKAWHAHQLKLDSLEASKIATAVLAWHRDGTCRACHGLGFETLGGESGGKAVLTERDCPVCKGTRKVPFDRNFTVEQLVMARWLRAEVEREQALAGGLAMQSLAPKLGMV